MKILIYDIENSPNLAWVWGKWQQDVIEFEKEWELLSFAYKWLGEKEVTCVSRREFKDKTDKSITRELFEVLDSADIVITYNGDSHDNKRVNTKILEYELGHLSPFASIDLIKPIRKHFKFNSNKMTDVCQKLGLGKKESHAGFATWLGCIRGEKESWEVMEKYNIKDVVLLERLYKRVRPWIENHPSVSLFHGRLGCPKCGSSRTQFRGSYLLKNKSRVKKVWCRGCDSWFTQKAKKA